MKIRSIYIEVKKSKNFQTYTYGETIDIEDGDDIETIRAHTQALCRKKVMQQFELDKVN